MRKLTAAILIFMTSVFCAVPVTAEPPKARRGFGPPQNFEKALEHFEMLTMWRMMDALDLDKAKGEKIYAIRRKFTAEKKAIMKELGQQMETLRARLQEDTPNLDEKELTRIIKSIREKRRRLESLRDRQYDEISNILSVVQQAQLLIFMKDFQDEIRAFIRRPMMPPPGPPPPLGGPPPPGPADPFAGPADF